MSTDTLTSNHFGQVIDSVDNAPQSKKLEAAFNGISQQLKQSSNQQMTGQQWGTELQQITPQLVKACQQGG
jgi:hypothetical protein